ncbi:hypothetical protein TNCT_526141 [Trichonephila clavata]|uniref:STPR domain-containing protein n=1 Tax=Trichonephila clavata TaxID=2740835 RepID=A0A8X6LM14_TRICU|nr:hypothetical protein TNCT_526141 [Trichonephila clavata]
MDWVIIDYRFENRVGNDISVFSSCVVAIRAQSFKQQNASRAAETPEQRQSRLHKDQVHHRVARAAETPEQRQSRLQEDQVHHRVARATETPIHGKEKLQAWSCSSGKVKLPPILKPPELLYSLLKGETAQSKDFVKHIRLFNNMFAMTSFKSNVVLNNGWTPTSKAKCTTMLERKLYFKPGHSRILEAS